MREWRCELWHVRHDAPSGRIAWSFCLGALPDALYIRRHVRRGSPSRDYFQTPASCSLVLVGAVFLSYFVALCVPGSRDILHLGVHTDLTPYVGLLHFQVSDSPPNPIDQQILLFRVTLTFSFFVLPAVTSFRFGSRTQTRGLDAYLLKARWAAFFLLKFLLILPLVFLSALDLGQILNPLRVGGLFPEMAVSLAGFVLLFRWAIHDHRRRCPVCLSRVQCPVEIGQASSHLMDRQVTEYICPRGHGFLQVRQESVNWSPDQRWIAMDPW
jgi:hypothetical protein